MTLFYYYSNNLTIQTLAVKLSTIINCGFTSSWGEILTSHSLMYYIFRYCVYWQWQRSQLLQSMSSLGHLLNFLPRHCLICSLVKYFYFNITLFSWYDPLIFYFNRGSTMVISPKICKIMKIMTFSPSSTTDD